jgi:ssDNA-binding Zn-finger/Zn-ribbon topoisomerase 1
MKMAIQPTRSNSATLVDLIDRILDKGIVINADITVSICGVELLGVKVRAAVASFETAAKYGLEFPSGTNLTTESWRRIEQDIETCPNCNKRLPREDLLRVGCPWCGWSRPKLFSSESSMES